MILVQDSTALVPRTTAVLDVNTSMMHAKLVRARMEPLVLIMERATLVSVHQGLRAKIVKRILSIARTTLAHLDRLALILRSDSTANVRSISLETIVAKVSVFSGALDWWSLVN